MRTWITTSPRERMTPTQMRRKVRDGRKILTPPVYCYNFRLLKRLLCVCVSSIVQRRTHICNLRREMRSMMKRGTEYQYIRRLDYSFIYPNPYSSPHPSSHPNPYGVSTTALF